MNARIKTALCTYDRGGVTAIRQSFVTCKQRIIIIFVSLLLVSACSLKTIYNQLDYLIPSYVEGMVSLDDALGEKLETRTQTLINWHRNTQLKQYADLLRGMQTDLDAPLGEDRVIQHITTMETLWRILAVKLNDEMASLLPLLNTGQREELFASIDEKNEDYYDEYVDIDQDERIELYTDSMLDNYENWFGELNDNQIRQIEQSADQLSSSAGLRLQQRKIWQSNIRNILKSADTAETQSVRLSAFFAEYNSGYSRKMAVANDNNKQVFAQLTIGVVANLTAEQKQHFIDKTNDYIRIFTELADNR